MSTADELGLADDLNENDPVDVTVAKIIRHVSAVRGSDLFLESDEHVVQVDCRQMGVIQSIRPFTLDYGRRMMAYVKTMADIDLSERNRPCEGRWLLRREGQSTIDLRVNSIPTIFGDDITLRLLDRDIGLMSLDRFEFQPREYELLTSILHRPSGLLLVTGPTGSGKTTTMYGCLQFLNDGTRKINTLEDPVEYVVKGIRQSQVNAKFGVDFPELLAACLRQSPDVIMIGEIRDPKTALTAVRAANSGHLVLATMHSPVAVKAIRAMVTFGVQAQNFAEALIGIISQRLVRKLCQHCRQRVDLPENDEFLDDVRPLLPHDWTPMLYEPGRCVECHNVGFTKPICVPEILPFDTDLRRLVAECRPLAVLDKAAHGTGMVTFRQSAMTRVALGQTTLQEVMRVVPFDDLRELEREEWEEPLRNVIQSVSRLEGNPEPES